MLILVVGVTAIVMVVLDSRSGDGLRIIRDNGHVRVVTGRMLTEADLVSDRVLLVPNQLGDEPGCSAGFLLEQVQALFDGLAVGDTDLGTRFFAGPERPDWGWYRIYAPLKSDTPNPGVRYEELDRYLVQRHDQGERVRVAALQVVSSTQRGAEAFVPHLYRTAKDLSAGEHYYSGKASVDCTSGKFLHMNLLPQRRGAGIRKVPHIAYRE